MRSRSQILTLILVIASFGCSSIGFQNNWQASVDYQVSQLGYRNWIIITEASFPAHSRNGIRQINADSEVPEVVDYVLNALEITQHVSPRIYLTREMRSVDNNSAPGIDELREKIKESLHGHETNELDQESLLTLVDTTKQNFNVLVIRTNTSLPYSSVFLELQPGYWDADSESELRKRISVENMESLAPPTP